MPKRATKRRPTASRSKSASRSRAQSSAKRRTSSSTKSRSTSKAKTKVGASRSAAVNFAKSKRDFGIPARVARRPREGGRDKGRPEVSGPMPIDEGGRRETGVGTTHGAPAGSGSGGDASADFTGAGTGGSTVSETPAGELPGPDTTHGGSAPFASGPPARGENQDPRSAARRRPQDTTHNAFLGPNASSGTGQGLSRDYAQHEEDDQTINPLTGGPARPNLNEETE